MPADERLFSMVTVLNTLQPTLSFDSLEDCMRLTRRTASLAVAVTAVVGGLALAIPAANAAPSPTGAAHRAVRVCPVAPAGMASCHAWVRTDITPAATPAGYGPADPPPADHLTTSGPSRPTIPDLRAFDRPDR